MFSPEQEIHVSRGAVGCFFSPCVLILVVCSSSLALLTQDCKHKAGNCSPSPPDFPVIAITMLAGSLMSPDSPSFSRGHSDINKIKPAKSKQSSHFPRSTQEEDLLPPALHRDEDGLSANCFGVVCVCEVCQEEEENTTVA